MKFGIPPPGAEELEGPPLRLDWRCPPLEGPPEWLASRSRPARGWAFFTSTWGKARAESIQESVRLNVEQGGTYRCKRSERGGRGHGRRAWEGAKGGRSRTCLPSISILPTANALSQASSSANVTNPNPLLLALSRSSMTCASSTWPYELKNCLKTSMVVDAWRPPTKILAALRCSSCGIARLGSIWIVRAEEKNRREGDQHQKVSFFAR